MALPSNHNFSVGQKFYRVFFSNGYFYIREVYVASLSSFGGFITIHTNARGDTLHDDVFSHQRGIAELFTDRKEAAKDYAQKFSEYLNAERKDIDEREEVMLSVLNDEGIPDAREQAVNALEEACEAHIKARNEYVAADETYINFVRNNIDDPEFLDISSMLFHQAELSKEAAQNASLKRFKCTREVFEKCSISIEQQHLFKRIQNALLS